jgi:predicted nucleotidyltransferase
MQMQSLPNFDLLVQKFDSPSVKAMVLMGSYARGTAGLFSDVDLVRFTSEGDVKPSISDGSYLIDDFLVTISSVSPRQIEEWFSCPEIAVNVISGIRTAHPLLDRSSTFEVVQRRAQAFTWDAEMQQKANHWASQQMVGWIEEVHKGLEGLRRKDIGRMLNARFGCSWGLSRVVGVHKGLLLSEDNSFYDEVGEAVGMDSEWVRLRRVAFGIEGQDGKAPSLREQVVAGLRLYVATVQLLGHVLEPTDAVLVKQTVTLIETELGSQ